MKYLHAVAAALLGLLVSAPLPAQPPYRPRPRPHPGRIVPSPYQEPYRQSPYDQPPPPPQGEGRHLWLYGSDGRFEQVRGDRWVEVNGSGEFHYREVGRTPEYVELYDEDREVWVRLFPDRQVNHGIGATHWEMGPRGRWAE